MGRDAVAWADVAVLAAPGCEDVGPERRVARIAVDVAAPTSLAAVGQAAAIEAARRVERPARKANRAGSIHPSARPRPWPNHRYACGG
jgi:hypothetical protein